MADSNVEMPTLLSENQEPTNDYTEPFVDEMSRNVSVHQGQIESFRRY